MFVVTVLLSALFGAVGGGVGALLGRLVTRRTAGAGAKRTGGMVRAVGLGVGLSLGPVVAASAIGDTVAVGLGVKSRSELVLGEAMRPFLEDPRLKAQLQGNDAVSARTLSQSLVARGITLLPAGDLERWASLRLRLAEASPLYCAAAWRGGLETKDSFRALDALTREEQERWGALVARAAQLALDTPPAPTPSARALERGILAVAETLPPAERADFDREVGLADPGAERACELFQIVLRGALSLPPPEREALLRALAIQGQ